MTLGSDAVTRDSGTLDPRRLLIFREIARRGSLSAAAEALGWTQPAVGQHLRRLERDLGLSLAQRSTRGVTLTDAGTRLLTHADAVASRLDAAKEEMSALRTLRAGRLRVAAFPSACAILVPPVLAHLASVAPDLEVRLTEAEPPEARAAVLAGEVDVAVLFRHRGAEGTDAHPDLISHELFEDPVHAVLPNRHRLADPSDPTKRLSLGKLATEPWIAGCPRCRTHLQTLAADAGFTPDIRHTTDDYVVVQTLVAAGLGVALLPGLALAAAGNDQVIDLPLAGKPSRHITLVHRHEASAAPATQAGIRAFTESFPTA